VVQPGDIPPDFPGKGGREILNYQPDLARAELKDVLSDDVHAPTFQRKRDRVWVQRAKSLMGKL